MALVEIPINLHGLTRQTKCFFPAPQTGQQIPGIVETTRKIGSEGSRVLRPELPSDLGRLQEGRQSLFGVARFIESASQIVKAPG